MKLMRGASLEARQLVPVLGWREGAHQVDASDLNVALVVRVADLHREHPGVPDDRVVELLVAEGIARHEALFAAVIVPIAFGRPVLQKLGIVPSPDFLLKDESGAWVSYLFGEQPISRAALRVAVARFVHGPRDAFTPSAKRSAELDAVSKALAANASLSGATLSPPCVWGVSPEELGATGRRS